MYKAQERRRDDACELELELIEFANSTESAVDRAEKVAFQLGEFCTGWQRHPNKANAWQEHLPVGG